MLKQLFLTLGVALGTAGMQVVMKGISRPNPPGKNHALEREDALFWSDWILAGGVALAGSTFALSAQGQPIPPSRLMAAIVAILVGCACIPFFLRVWAYDPNTHKFKQWGWKGTGWILIANILGILILFLAILTGVNIHG